MIFYTQKKEGLKQVCSFSFSKSLDQRKLFKKEADGGSFKIVWKDSKHKRFIYDTDDMWKKSIKPIIQKGGWQRIKFTSSAC